jgi:hypothetical protein
MSLSLACVLVSAIAGIRSALTWVTTVAVCVECMALAANRGRCPLSTLAERLGDDSGPVTSIFFPRWFLPWVTPTFVLLALAGVGLIILR